MGNETFIDTSGFYALLVKLDDKHDAARSFMRSAARRRLRMVTTDYILDETATLLKARGHGHLLAALFQTAVESRACRIEWMNPERFSSVAAFFAERSDQGWSFTDCFSFLVMKEARIGQALTKDAHFHEAGFIPLLV